ncbi:MAG: hypothetical protein NTV22_07950, partial [bacterium]|nr:hypothetical protein [bacterium]
MPMQGEHKAAGRQLKGHCRPWSVPRIAAFAISMEVDEVRANVRHVKRDSLGNPATAGEQEPIQPAC